MPSGANARKLSKTVFLALPQRIGCPILRVFCEGWDKEKLRGKGLVESSGIPPFAKSAKDGATDPLWQGKKYCFRLGNDTKPSFPQPV